jgi:hypothetical protein
MIILGKLLQLKNMNVRPLKSLERTGTGGIRLKKAIIVMTVY